MNRLEELKKTWVGEARSSGEIQASMWDQVAGEFSGYDRPDFKNNDVLKLIDTVAKPDKTMSSLDIGCGCGNYSLALARRVNLAVGVDLSPKMINYAKAGAAEQGIENADFRCLDWAEADIPELNFERRFDIVFANMTPAIANFETFDKMNACAKKFCFLTKKSRWINSIIDRAFEVVGMDPAGATLDDEIVYVFDYLWYSGYRPQFLYGGERVWTADRSAEDMAAWCVNRAKLRRDLSPEEERAIRGYVDSITTDGTIQEKVVSNAVTIYWQV